MEIVFSVVAFLLLVSVLLALLRPVRRLAISAALTFAVVELVIWFAAPQFPSRIRSALRSNVARTSSNPEYPELKTRVYSTDPEHVARAVSNAIATRPAKWALDAATPPGGDLHATVKVLMFTDDVYIHMEREDAATRVDVRSQSRVGKGDFGENRRHIQWLLEQLDERLR